MTITAYTVASRFLGLKEVHGAVNNPAIVAMLRLEDPNINDDETPWCSAFVNAVCWLINLPRSKSLAARSWLNVGSVIPIEQAAAAFDVVVLKRGGPGQPGPEVLAAPGHVGFFAGADTNPVTHLRQVHILGGNQGDQVSIAAFPVDRILGIRALQI